jgi:hypothetical protein
MWIVALILLAAASTSASAAPLHLSCKGNVVNVVEETPEPATVLVRVENYETHATLRRRERPSASAGEGGPIGARGPIEVRDFGDATGFGQAVPMPYHPRLQRSPQPLDVVAESAISGSERAVSKQDGDCTILINSM